jgi:hypothetical protein
VLVGSRSADRAKPLTIARTIFRNWKIKYKSADRAKPLTIDTTIVRNWNIKYKSADRAKPLTIATTILRNWNIKYKSADISLSGETAHHCQNDLSKLQDQNTFIGFLD